MEGQLQAFEERMNRPGKILADIWLNHTDFLNWAWRFS
jgi:hypothetical protein